MAEMYRLTGDDSILSMFETDIASHAFSPMNWMNPEMFGYFTLYRDTRIKQSLKDSIEVRFKGWCDDIISKASASGYGVGRSSADYYWESNEDVLHGACGLLMGYEMTANANYKDAALSQLGYILGNNSLNKSFVTKTGTNYSSKSYNWIWYDYAILAPGWVSGGPNSYSAGAGSDTPLITLINKGTPPAKCWLDIAASNGSYASNEGEATENAALVFLSGYFYSVLYPETGGVKKTLNRTK
jgi:endoglucanase